MIEWCVFQTLKINMMKKVLLICLVSILGNAVFGQADGLDIVLQHEISLEEDLNGPTAYFAHIDNHLLMYDAHVSNRTLICVDGVTGEKEWSIDEKVHDFFIHDKDIVVEFFNYIAVYDVKTGKQVWRIDSGSVDNKYELASCVSEN
jgi:hypothetical protein